MATATIYSIDTGMIIAECITKGKRYEINKRNHYNSRGAHVTRETTIKYGTILDVLEIVQARGEDVNEIITELDDLGCAYINGYSFFQI